MPTNSDSISQFFDSDEYEHIEFKYHEHKKILIKPMYFEQGFSNKPEIFGRKAVLDRLLKAVDLLPHHYGFLIWDVYRNREVQAKLFKWMYEQIQQKFPHFSNEEIHNETKKYMSEPSKVGDPYCPPHLSGGAIDLTLYDFDQNKEVEMGTSFDDCSEYAHSDFFDKNSPSNLKDTEVKNNRNILKNVMNTVGFTSYQYEWWHYDIGNIFWSRATGNQQAFGPLFGDYEWKNF